MFDIAIGIPTFNEADIIKRTTSIIDRGLVESLNSYKCVIVNSDNASSDGTREKFLSTKTRCSKVYISTSPGKKGKGLNLLNFLKWCEAYTIKYIAMIDADIKSLDSTWPFKMLKPLLSRRGEYVTPLYRRKRFEGSTTNHFAFPFIYTFFGKKIRQPIGGDFAMSRDVYRYFLNQSIKKEVLSYGIDIFMTIHALGKKSKICQIYLGKKIHKPSFEKIIPMFYQVCVSALVASRSYDFILPFSRVKQQIDYGKINIDRTRNFSQKTQVKEMADSVRNIFIKNLNNYKRILPPIFLNRSFKTVKDKVEKKRFTCNKEEWADILSEFFVYFSQTKPDYSLIKRMAYLITPLFLWRTFSFWFQSERKSAFDSEKEILSQAELIRRMTIKKLKMQRNSK